MSVKVINATKATATYNTSSPRTTFAAFGLQPGERIDILLEDGDGVYQTFTYRDASGVSRNAEITADNNTVFLNVGDFQINKPATAEAVKVVQY